MGGEISGEKTSSLKGAKYAKDARKTDHVDFALLRGFVRQPTDELFWLFHTFELAGVRNS
jgi:hypothetical protein